MEIISLARLHMLPVSSPHGAGSFINKDCCEVLMLPGSCYLENAPNQAKGSRLLNAIPVRWPRGGWRPVGGHVRAHVWTSEQDSSEIQPDPQPISRDLQVDGDCQDRVSAFY